jgi:hypothetical protein
MPLVKQLGDVEDYFGAILKALTMVPIQQSFEEASFIRPYVRKSFGNQASRRALKRRIESGLRYQS